MDELTHIIIDCDTGETTTVSLTPEELAQREVDAAAAQAQVRVAHAARMEQKAADATDHALIREAATPGTTITNAHFAALGRKLGVL